MHQPEIYRIRRSVKAQTLDLDERLDGVDLEDRRPHDWLIRLGLDQHGEAGAQRGDRRLAEAGLTVFALSPEYAGRRGMGAQPQGAAALTEAEVWQVSDARGVVSLPKGSRSSA